MGKPFLSGIQKEFLRKYHKMLYKQERCHFQQQDYGSNNRYIYRASCKMNGESCS